MAPGLPPLSSSGYTILKRAGLEGRLLHPKDAEYKARQASFWSASARIAQPAVIVQPRSADEVALAVKALAAAGERFAVRSGGHTQYAQANNIDSGVTIDLGLLTWTRYKPETESVDVGPGGRWRDVYTDLRPHKRVVAGGREGGVGIAGLLLGGGNTFFTARHGFACDNVLAYEVVLADGKIITADSTQHADLFLALKGGSSNFGIVTNFTLKAIESDEVWGGLAIFPKQLTAQATEALVQFTDNIPNEIDSNLLTFYTYMDVVITAMYAQVAGVARAPAYAKWLALPEVATTYKQTSIAEMAQEYNLPTDYYNTWFTATFLNDARIVAHAAEEHERLVDRLKAAIPDGDFITQCLFQPLPCLFAQRSVEAGGNVLGLERQKNNGLLWLAAIMVRTPEQEKLAYEEAQGWVQSVRGFAATIAGGNFEWQYLNYADGSQDPLKTYGADSGRKLREVSSKYDPEQVFQKLVPGGFKISRSGIADVKPAESAGGEPAAPAQQKERTDSPVEGDVVANEKDATNVIADKLAEMTVKS